MGVSCPRTGGRGKDTTKSFPYSSEARKKSSAQKIAEARRVVRQLAEPRDSCEPREAGRASFLPLEKSSRKVYNYSTKGDRMGRCCPRCRPQIALQSENQEQLTDEIFKMTLEVPKIDATSKLEEVARIPETQTSSLLDGWHDYLEQKNIYLPNWAEVTIIELSQFVTFLGVRLGNVKNNDLITMAAVLLGYTTFIYAHVTWLTRAKSRMTVSQDSDANE